ncbi:hypothetical protein ACQ4M3_13030 [Leptolyngbya sp. AN03gr2]|uniref:hypothetical protein n=1 Tax=unclassified Leptolyngbya TaxID=2650499 RepID=UPI003D31DBFC
MKRLLQQIDLFLIDLVSDTRLYWTLILLPFIMALLNILANSVMLSSAVYFVSALFWVARGRVKHTQKQWKSYLYWIGIALYAPYFMYIAVVEKPGLYGHIANAGYVIAIVIDLLTNNDHNGGSRRRSLRQELEESSVRTETSENLTLSLNGETKLFHTHL